MYCPPAFVANDRDKMTALIRACLFGMQILCDQGRADVTHLPFMRRWDEKALGEGRPDRWVFKSIPSGGRG